MRVKVSDRPAGGTFTPASEPSALADQALGSVELDAAGNIYVFFISNKGTNALALPNVAKHLEGRVIKKFFYRPGKIISIASAPA